MGTNSNAVWEPSAGTARCKMFEADDRNGNFTTMNHSDEMVGYMGFCNN